MLPEKSIDNTHYIYRNKNSHFLHINGTVFRINAKTKYIPPFILPQLLSMEWILHSTSLTLLNIISPKMKTQTIEGRSANLATMFMHDYNYVHTASTTLFCVYLFYIIYRRIMCKMVNQRSE